MTKQNMILLWSISLSRATLLQEQQYFTPTPFYLYSDTASQFVWENVMWHITFLEQICQACNNGEITETVL